MRVCDLIVVLAKAPAGAKVFIETKKPIEELLEDNLSDDETVADISFGVRGAGHRKSECIDGLGEFVIRF